MSLIPKFQELLVSSILPFHLSSWVSQRSFSLFIVLSLHKIALEHPHHQFHLQDHCKNQV